MHVLTHALAPTMEIMLQGALAAMFQTLAACVMTPREAGGARDMAVQTATVTR
jgi:hypothetical protein